ncbi:MAG: putative tRNA threonylcarbamoyladenosine biosynthesis protein Gcp [Candidatus Gottesmanbacteria bacterium GW2011_GWC1_43_10]|nr:MAG: putative tRNA threonylcarbamoyladenosine biosynthesis protein Gcp [Candidatus Gottesmanbacteria bacterium GW2011_GWC1_43_10]
MKILGIESSCDETAAAVVEDLSAGRQVELKILTNVIASSTLMHRKYGGIVPEVAARKQVASIIPVLTEALTPFISNQQFSSKGRSAFGGNNATIKQSFIPDIDAIAVTVGPGLIGSLLIGVETAKTLAFAWNKPIIPVNHVIAHMYANFIFPVIPSEVEESLSTNFDAKDSSTSLRSARNDNTKFPAISLVVSGGHTELFLMTDEKTLKWLGGTLDDAAGEAFDKTARLLGFENKGGPAIQQAAQEFIDHNSPSSPVTLPRPLMDDSLNFSFSGLKTAILREVNNYFSRHSGKPEGTHLPAGNPRSHYRRLSCQNPKSCSKTQRQIYSYLRRRRR